MNKILLETKNLKKYFSIKSGLSKKTTGFIKAVDGVDLQLKQSKTLALVGESGSGKTTIGKVILRTYSPTEGKIIFRDIDITHFRGKELKNMRRKIKMVYQDPSSSLNPLRKVKDIIIDPLNIHKIGLKRERKETARDIIKIVGLTEEYLYRYPHELSGGEKQRVGIARAIISKPELVILDEPTSSLDVSVQANIIKNLKELQEQYSLTYLFISHNLSLVRNFADETAVMYLGRIMEKAPTIKLFHEPKHPYTIALLSMIPIINSKEEKMLPQRIKLKGEIPNPTNIPKGCRFVTRCPMKKRICSEIEPKMLKINSHEVRCHLIS